MRRFSHLVGPSLAFAGALGVPLAATPPRTVDFAYFLDVFEPDNLNAVPAGTMVIGTSTSAQRQALTAAGRIVGSSAGLGADGGSRIAWNDGLKALFNQRNPPDLSTASARTAFANQIFATARVGSDAFPDAAEATPTAAGGYVAWTQDFEGPLGDPQEMAAAIIALNWAGRTLLTPAPGGQAMQIVPVPASVLQKVDAATWRLSEVVAGRRGDRLLSFLALDGTLSQEDRTALVADRIDLFSFMHLASAEGRPLVDGILAQQYSGHGCPSNCQYVNCAAVPGSLSDDTPAFYASTLPYAVQSAHDNPPQLFLPPGPSCPDAVPPFTSNHRGRLPMRAGVYWSGTVDSSFDPSAYLAPTAVSAPAGCPADLNGDGIVGPADIGLLLAAWGSSAGDLNGDDATDAADLGVLLESWGESCELDATNDWIKVLVAESEPPGPDQYDDYVARISKLAPSLEQIHLRWAAGRKSANPSDIAQLIAKLRNRYGATLKIGFHPDNSRTSCRAWGCSEGVCAPTSPQTWQCVLSASIETMNAVNGIAEGRGFDIFSIEQSYVEDVGGFLPQIRSCLAGDATALPGVTPADPPVDFANVTGSYPGADQLGADGYAYAYPQYYNLGKKLPADAQVLYQAADPYFPGPSAEDCLPAGAADLRVVDVDMNASYPEPKIPCFDPANAPNVYTSTATGAPGVDPDLAAAYVAFLMTQYPPISNQPELGGSTVYVTFSGEPEFLGAEGWTLDEIAAFHAALVANFDRLRTLVPSLFPEGGADPASIEYAIWNFDAILQSIELP